MGESIVQKKINKLILRELSTLLSMNSRFVPFGIMVTVSEVKITVDLSLAKVYITVLPDSKLEETIAALNEESWAIRRDLSRRIRNKLRKMPDLRFYVDNTFMVNEEVDNLFDKIREEEEVLRKQREEFPEE